MKETLLMKYAVGGITVAVGFVIFMALALVARHYRGTKKNIIFHGMQSLILCLIVVVITQYALMALVDFHFKYISASAVNMISTALLLIILLHRVYQFIDIVTAAQINKHGDPTSAHIIARLSKIIIFIMIMLLFGEHFGMSLSGLLAFGGIGGIALGMAGKDVLSNFFSGVILYFDRPFNIGDWVSSPDKQIEGTVQEIGWRLTKILTFDHRPLYVPNSVFSSISVENPGRMSNRRIKTEIGLRYNDADKIGVVVNDIRTMLEQNVKIDQNQTLLVYFNDFADSSLNIMVYCFTKTTKWSEWLAIQQDVYLAIIDIVHKHGADFAFPTQTLYVEKDDGTEVAQPVVAQAVASSVTEDTKK